MIHSAGDDDTADERSARAGEYVLGTLDDAGRRALETRLPADAALRAEVYVWQDRLLALTRRVAPVEPPAGGWQSIDARLTPAVPWAREPSPNTAHEPQRRQLRRWQFASAAALAASLVLATVLALRGPVQPADVPRYVAVLTSPTSHTAGWVVEATAGGQVRLVPVDPAASVDVPPGKALQFWTKAEGAAGPTSLGLVTAGVATTVPSSRLPTLGARQLFELTLEPAAGSPLPRPTGPVLFLGRSVPL